jgi:predicted amidophosphoribosyltransferase
MKKENTKKKKAVTTKKNCLKCDKSFNSEGNFNRICPVCRAEIRRHSSWTVEHRILLGGKSF